MLPTRPVSPSLREPPPFDPPRLIQEAMGGREFFWEIGAKAVHRVGLSLGLGWRLPFGEARDGVDFVRVTVEKVAYERAAATERPENVPRHLTFLMEFLRIRSFDGDGNTKFNDLITPNHVMPEPDIQLIKALKGVPLSGLRATYEGNTINV